MHVLTPRAALFVTCLLTHVVAQGPTNNDSFARDLAALSKRNRSYAEQIQRRLSEMRVDLRLVAVIPNLTNGEGSFCDVDGDRDLDFVATEISNRREEVRLHLNSAAGWRVGASRSRGLDQKQPLSPWFLEDDGSGRRAIVQPVGLPPYLFLLPLSSSGGFAGKPVSLLEHLPRRLSRPQGAGNCPYVLESCQSASGSAPARIVGRMTDEMGGSVQDVHFEIVLGKRGLITTEVRQIAPKARFGAVPSGFAVVRSPADCEHESGERASILGSELGDVNEDGIDDVVLFSGVLSAHVFPGVRRSGRIEFGKEFGFGRAVPIEDLRLWFPFGLQAQAGEAPYAHVARAQLARLGFRIDRNRSSAAAFTIRTERRQGWFLNYYMCGSGLVPVQDYRRGWPHAATGNHPLIEKHRQAVVLDADHDRTPDLLSVHVGQQFTWLQQPPDARAAAPEAPRREVEPGRLRCGLVLGLGERREDDGANRVLALFDDVVSVAKKPNDVQPISVREVSVYEGLERRSRYCVLLRPRRLGLFFELQSVSPDVARARRYAAWLRRAERRLEMHQHYRACDRNQCESSERVHSEVFADAILLFQRGLPLARSRQEQARIWRHVARCHALAGQLAIARRSYEKFVMLGRRIEPLDRPHRDLLALFRDETFRVLHRGWAKTMQVVAAEAL